MTTERLSPIALGDRTMGFKETFGLWVAANVVITTVLTGMLFADQITLYQTLFAVVVGSLIGTIPLALTAKMGFRTGLPTMAIARGAFGHRGAALPAIVNGLVLIAWSWIQAYLAGVSLNYAVNFLFGYDNVNLFVLLTEAVVIYITIKGHKMIETLERNIANAMLLLSFIIFAVMFQKYDIHEVVTMQLAENPAITTIVAFDIVIATAFSWMSTVCDYNRHCKTDKASVFGTYAGYIVATFVAMMLGFTVGATSILSGQEVTYDPAILLANSGYGIYGFIASIVVFLSVVSTNVMALYSATYSFMAARPSLDFKKLVLALGIAAMAGALAKEALMTSFFDFVLLIATLFIPIFGIMLSDYFVINKGKYDAEEICSGAQKRYFYTGGINPLAYLTYILSAVFCYYFTYVSFLPIGSAIPTFFFSALLYIGLMKAFSTKVVAQPEVNNG